MLFLSIWQLLFLWLFKSYNEYIVGNTALFNSKWYFYKLLQHLTGCFWIWSVKVISLKSIRAVFLLNMATWTLKSGFCQLNFETCKTSNVITINRFGFRFKLLTMLVTRLFLKLVQWYNGFGQLLSLNSVKTSFASQKMLRGRWTSLTLKAIHVTLWFIYFKC